MPCCCCQNCVQVKNACNGQPIVGASVSLKQGATTVATATSTGMLTGVSVVNHGSGYKPATNPPTLSVAGTGTGATVAGQFAGGTLSSIALTSGGNGYVAPVITLTGAVFGTAAVATPIGVVASVVCSSGGSGYADGTYTDGRFLGGGGGSGARFSYTVVGGVVQPTCTVTAQGAGYTFAPNPVFPGGGIGGGARGSSTMKLTSISITGQGALYETAPTATLSDPAGHGAVLGTVAVATITIGSILVTSPGSGYGVSGTTITITGGSGSGATATATVTVQGCLGPVPYGIYTLTVSQTAFADYVTSVTLPTTPACSSLVATPLPLTVCTVTTQRCGSALPGVTWSLAGSPGTFTGTTNASGLATISVPPGTYNSTLTYPTGTSYMLSGVVVSACTPFTLGLVTSVTQSGASLQGSFPTFTPCSATITFTSGAVSMGSFSLGFPPISAAAVTHADVVIGTGITTSYDVTALFSDGSSATASGVLFACGGGHTFTCPP